MKRLLLGAVLVALFAMTLAPTPAQARTSVGFSLRFGDPYRGGYFSFHSEPRCIVVPRTRVYVVRDYDCDLYRYGGDWYYYDDDYWYCAPSYRGPFVRLSYRSVPYQVRYVCDSGGYRRWEHRARYRDYDRDWDRRDRDWYRDDRDWHRDRDWRDRERRDRDDDRD